MQSCVLFSACEPDGRLLRSILEKSFQDQAHTHYSLSTNHDSQPPMEGAFLSPSKLETGTVQRGGVGGAAGSRGMGTLAQPPAGAKLRPWGRGGSSAWRSRSPPHAGAPYMRCRL